MRVLVIDDDPFTLELLSEQLAGLGVEDVQICASAQMALARLTGDDFDVLLVDLNMPGMDGVEFMRHLARARFRGGLVLVSGQDERILQSAAKLARARRLKVLGALPKPVAPTELEALLAAWTPQGLSSVMRVAPGNYDAAELREAFETGQLVNYYQPQVGIASGRVIGVEALVRWRRRNEGLLLPAQFLPAIETHGLGAALAREVGMTALRDLRLWRDAGLRLRLSVNVTMDSLAELDLPDRLVRAAANAGVPTTDLVVEVTESQAMRDRAALLDIATRLRLKGIGLSIDDFGTGYSSLAQLRDIPFDELKLDRSFVHGAAGNADLHAILEANLAMAKQLGLRSVAEGIEDHVDLECLRALGCDLAQGYLIAAPMPASALLPWVAGRASKQNTQTERG